MAFIYLTPLLESFIHGCELQSLVIEYSILLGWGNRWIYSCFIEKAQIMGEEKIKWAYMYTIFAHILHFWDCNTLIKCA
jgi:hypothetical protein